MAESRKNNETSMHVMSGIKSQHDGMGKAIVKKIYEKEDACYR